MGEPRSIHPRNWTGWWSDDKRRKLDTSKRKSEGTKIRVINAVSKYCEANPRDAMAAAHLSKLKAAM